MYIYTFELKFSKKKTPLNFNKCKDVINEAIEAVNAGITFKRDGKKFLISKSDENTLVLVLSSNKALANPSRSISALTRYLTTYHTKLFKDSIFNKTLFSIELLSQEQTASEFPKDLSNEELLKGLIDLLYGHTATSNSDTLKRNSVIHEIKLLVAPYIK